MQVHARAAMAEQRAAGATTPEGEANPLIEHLSLLVVKLYELVHDTGRRTVANERDSELKSDFFHPLQWVGVL